MAIGITNWKRTKPPKHEQWKDITWIITIVTEIIQIICKAQRKEVQGVISAVKAFIVKNRRCTHMKW